MISSRKSFTLIELLIVITIIGILAVALIPRIAGAPARARDVQRKADLDNISKALAMYYADHGEYPNYQAAGGSSCTSYTLPTPLAPYMPSGVPHDPTNLDAIGCGSSASNYAYSTNTARNGYFLVAQLETDTASGDNICSALTGLTLSDPAYSCTPYTGAGSQLPYYVIGR